MKKTALLSLFISYSVLAAEVEDNFPLSQLPEGTVFKFHQMVDLYYCKQFATQIFNGEMSCKNFKVKSHVIFDGPRGLFEGSQTQITAGQTCTLKYTPSFNHRFYFKEENCPQFQFEMNWEGIKNYTTRVEDLRKVLGEIISIEAPEE